MEKTIFSGQRVCNEVLHNLFKGAYFTRKQSIPYSKFPTLCKLLMFVKTLISSSMYQDEKTCMDLIWSILVVIQKKQFVGFEISHYLALWLMNIQISMSLDILSCLQRL